MRQDMALIALIFGLGCLGGLANELVIGIFRPPSRVFQRVRKKRIFIGINVGTLGTILVGGIAAFAFWALSLSNPNAPQIYGTAIISGFGGARILSSLLEQRLAEENKDKLAEELGKVIDEENK